MLWIDRPAELLRISGTADLLPTCHSAPDLRLNAALRLGIILGVLLSIALLSPGWLLLPCAIAAATVVYRAITRRRPGEAFMTGTAQQEAPPCTMPTPDNPYMNVLVNEIEDNPDRPPACPDVAQESRNAFYAGMPRNADDLFDRQASDWAFYTTPNTQIPSNRDMFMSYMFPKLSGSAKAVRDS